MKLIVDCTYAAIYGLLFNFYYILVFLCVYKLIHGCFFCYTFVSNKENIEFQNIIIIQPKFMQFDI